MNIVVLILVFDLDVTLKMFIISISCSIPKYLYLPSSSWLGFLLETNGIRVPVLLALFILKKKKKAHKKCHCQQPLNTECSCMSNQHLNAATSKWHLCVVASYL